MKKNKIIASLVALSMIVGIAVPAFAAGESATIANVEVVGTVGVAISGATASISITSDTLSAAPTENEDLSGWFTNLPNGITVVADAGATTTSVTVKFAGTPTATSTDAMTIQIPAASLTGGTAITVTANPDAKWNIAPAPTYSISLDKTGTHTFAAETEGYSSISPLTVTVTNTGNQATGALTAALSGTNSSDFALTGANISDIASTNSTATFTVGPNDGLAAGTYTATVTVTGSNSITATFDVSFTVNAATPTKVVLAAGSLGAADNTKITGLTSNKKYKITSNGTTSAVSADGTVGGEFVDYDGTTELTGTEITGLINGTTYKVEEVTATPPTEYALSVSTNDVVANDITATGTFKNGNDAITKATAGTSVTVAVTLSGNAAAAGTHTIGVSTAKGGTVTPPQTTTVAVTAGNASGTTVFYFTFVMPGVVVDDVIITNTFTAAPATKSVAPSFTATSVARTKKTGTNEGAITFTLSAAKANATFKVYDAITGGSEKAGFTAVLQSGNTDVKLTHNTDVPAGKYYISIDDDGAGTAFTESDRKEVTVTEWVANATKVATYNKSVADATALKAKYTIFDDITAQNNGKADMFPTEFSVIKANVTALETAITNAGTAYTAAVDDAAIVAATTTITNAMATFESAKVAGTKTYTDAQALLDIAAEEARVVGITINDAVSPSTVNKDVKYVSTAQMGVYTTALTAAKDLTGDAFNATNTLAKVNALKAATDTLLGQVKIGTKTNTVTPTPPTTNYPNYGGSGNSTPTTSPSNDLTTIVPNADLSANSPKGTEVEVPSSIADPTLDAREVAINSPVVKNFVDLAAKSGFAFAKAFEMNMFDGTTKVTAVSDGVVKISVPFAGNDKYNYVVLRYNDNGGITAMPALYKDGKITFTTNHFSLYAIAVQSTNKNLFADTTIKGGATGTTSVPQTSVVTLGKLF